MTIANDPDRYGPWAGILIGGENSDAIYAVDAAGQVTSYQLGIRAENINIVPAQENFFGVDFGGAAIYGASASQFKDMVGDVADVRGVQREAVARSLERQRVHQGTARPGDAVGAHRVRPGGMVEIGPATTVQVALAGTATDDAFPPGSTLTMTWSVAGGPGPVTFADSHAASTTATFGEPGTYVLRSDRVRRHADDLRRA